ncbi:M56 family metallopeptidase [Clostridium sp. P21]|uniref:M56 family metallopeptidase n=1 Tax=Clostridium muellerianum TaxID=2716538 RepID=A0A7Y0EK27_9CLOT|nr:M56 family metallopeptidase [Clostridium muellerianum]NMM64928.1 M56 family metallopeptidase [Clostridium muellerianum]
MLKLMETLFSFNEILNNCIKTMNIKKQISLMYTNYISSPCLHGIIHPIIFIPQKAAKNISDQKFKYIIMHELCHLKRKDILINWITIVLNAVYWFNLIIRYGFCKMKQDCEISCDSDVLKYLKNNENIQYGHTIIKILEINNANNSLIGTTSMIKNKSEIKRRIAMISRHKKVSLRSIILSILVVAIIGSVGLTKASNLKTDDNSSSVSVSEVNPAAGFDNDEHNNTFGLWSGKDSYKISENGKDYNINIKSNIKFGTVNIQIYNDKEVLFKKSSPKDETIKISKEDAKNVRIKATGILTSGSYSIHVNNKQKIESVAIRNFQNINT